MKWLPYLRNRLIAKHTSNFFVIIPNDESQIVPLSCPVCAKLFRSHDDGTSYQEFECCHLCAEQWAHSRRKEWKDGWRPPKEQIDEVVFNRPPLLVVFD